MEAVDIAMGELERVSCAPIGKPQVDFIVPCYNEEENAGRFYQIFLEAFSETSLDWRLIMVDDGSRDATYSELQNLAARDARVAVLCFSRNFGKEAAIYAGLKYSDADYIGIIDADLQQPPAVARDMLAKLIAEDSYDCVAAFQEERREGAMRSLLKSKFYSVFAKASRTSVVMNASDFRVFKRSVAEAILSMPEYYRFSKGLFAWVGFETLPWPYTPDERVSGESKWTFRSLLNYAFEGLLSFTTAPLHFITKVGVAVCVFAIIYALVLVVRTLLLGKDMPGYASMMCLILFFGGGQFLALGVIGEYLGRAYVQGKHRPSYIVKSSINIEE